MKNAKEIDGESQYDEYHLCKDEEEAREIVSSCEGGFMRALRDYDTHDVSEEEVKVLLKFGVV